jgi:lipoyl-dependent peroxiredoxin
MSHQDVHTAAATARPGTVATDDERVTVDTVAAGDSASNGATTPEHLMAAALASCLQQAVGIAASSQGLDASGASVRAEVTLTAGDSTGYDATFTLVVEGLGEAAERVVEQAAVICPFTSALAGERLSVSAG